MTVISQCERSSVVIGDHIIPVIPKQSSVSGVFLSPPPPFLLLLDSTLAYLTLNLGHKTVNTQQ